MPRVSPPIVDTNQIQTDHDILVKLATTTELNHKAVLDKVSSVQSDVLEVKSGVFDQLSKHDVRITMLEAFRQTKAADDRINFWDSQSKWVETYRGRWKWIMGLVSLASGVLVYLIEHLIPTIRFK